MIRYINLIGQIYNDNDPCFAWYDTVTDTFVSVDGEQIWDSWKEFKSSLVMYMVRGRVPENEQNETLARFYKLFPKQELKTGT